MAAAVAVHTTSGASIAAARASNMPGMGIVAAVTMAVADITAVEDTMAAAIRATTIKAADRG
jgi:hypothetical protein